MDQNFNLIQTNINFADKIYQITRTFVSPRSNTFLFKGEPSICSSIALANSSVADKALGSTGFGSAGMLSPPL